MHQIIHRSRFLSKTNSKDFRLFKTFKTNYSSKTELQIPAFFNHLPWLQQKRIIGLNICNKVKIDIFKASAFALNQNILLHNQNKNEIDHRKEKEFCYDIKYEKKISYTSRVFIISTKGLLFLNPS